MQKQVVNVHEATYEPIADLATWRPMPSEALAHLDPFLFLNHHGPQVYGPHNRGLPFGPHPHRGFETLTFVLQGDITHRDSVTGESVITAGGIQWMTAGRGLIHAEVSSDAFKEQGGTEEVIQLWMNLPARLKMTDPHYVGLQQAEIPALSLDEGRVTLNLISGEYNGQTGPVPSLTHLFTSTLQMQPGSSFAAEVPEGSQVLLYMTKGAATVNGQAVATHQLVQLSETGTGLAIEASAQSDWIFGYGMPFKEPVVAHGPFVMNTHEEIREAIIDYQAGRLGQLPG
jgi:hypothetical protein